MDKLVSTSSKEEFDWTLKKTISIQRTDEASSEEGSSQPNPYL